LTVLRKDCQMSNTLSSATSLGLIRRAEPKILLYEHCNPINFGPHKQKLYPVSNETSWIPEYFIRLVKCRTNTVDLLNKQKINLVPTFIYRGKSVFSRACEVFCPVVCEGRRCSWSTLRFFFTIFYHSSRAAEVLNKLTLNLTIHSSENIKCWI
jgi:hypothetical protein